MNQLNSPLCFILMPFGTKPASNSSGQIHFDLIYQQIIEPAVNAAGMEPIRADQEQVGGIIHKAMFERLLLCDYAVADLTTANANVFYELGVRHTHRQHATALIFAEGQGALPFDVNGLRGMPYKLNPDGTPAQPEKDAEALRAKLKGFRDVADQPHIDSPLFQLLQDFPDIQHRKTDVFREQANYSEQIKSQLADARALAMDDAAEALQAVAAVETGFDQLSEVEPGILVDLLLSYRAAKGWPAMVQLVEAMPRELRETTLVQEQYGFALNRDGQDRKAETVLKALIQRQGPSSETCGILGRIYKDRWQTARDKGKSHVKGLLKQAVEVYLQGFEADWRDAYPGINALTLMELSNPPDPRRIEINPVVTYAVKRRIAGGEPDYWDHATLLELAVLAGDQQKAEDALGDALAAQREPFEAETTARNLQLIRDARATRGENTDWLDGVIAALA